MLCAQTVWNETRNVYNSCMDELTIGDKIYISSKKAALITGYAKDYVGQLCREGHVEATMVGRSWYVLESSIRAHRFGNETKNDQPKAEEGKISGANPLRESWEAPAYRPEVSIGMPQLSPRPAAPAMDIGFKPQNAPVATLERSDEALTDMQTAWKEWFAQKQQNATEAPQVLVSYEEVIEIAEESDAANDDPEEESLPGNTEEAEFEPETDEEEVPIPFHTIRDETPQSSYIAPEEDAEPVRIHRAEEIEPVYAPSPAARTQVREEDDGVYIREYRTEKKVPARTRTRQGNGGSLLLQAALVGVMLLSVSIAVLGSGIGDVYAQKQGLQYAAIHFLNGTSVYEAK